MSTLRSPSCRFGFVIPFVCAFVFGCDGAPLDESTETAEQPLSCQGTSCDGINPNDSSCKLDMQDTGVGAPILDASGRAIGGIALFRSPSCQTVWASAAFYVAGGPRNFRICTVRVRASQNDPSCLDYNGSYGNDAPMKFANSGKTVFGKIAVDGRTTRTANLIVP